VKYICPSLTWSNFIGVETAHYPWNCIFQIDEAISAYDNGFSVEMTEQAKKRYAEMEKIRVEKFQLLYNLLCNKKYYAGSKYFVQLIFLSLTTLFWLSLVEWRVQQMRLIRGQ
jgi:hypothetical protein